MSLIRVVWGGAILDLETSAGVQIEEWSNSLSLIGPLDPDPESVVAAIAGAVEAYHLRPETGIDPTVRLQWVKVNEFDPVTGLQQTDPTVEHVFSGVGIAGASGSGSPHPITTSYRVSAEALGRARTGKGGWFVPRMRLEVGSDGRIAQADVDDALTSAVDFLGGLTSASYQPAIWSRKLGTLSAIHQLRIGDVPDNISTRKNRFPERYTTAVLP